MSKPRTNPPREPGLAQREGAGPGTAVRVIVSALLLWHVTAVFLAPLSVPPAPQLVADIAQRRPMQWYLDLLYLNHGYHFFAPDPGPGHLIRYELFGADGASLEQGEFPDRKVQWPRLWYHRHFMLADQGTWPTDDARVREAWERRYLENYARHLLRVNENAQTVRVQRIAHYPLHPDHAIEGRKLNDPATYETLMEVTMRRSDLGPSDADQSRLWQGTAPQNGAPQQAAAPQLGRAPQQFAPPQYAPQQFEMRPVGAPQQIGIRPAPASGWNGGRR